MPAGGISRRCRCRDADGKDLGSRCPQLSKRGHARWALRQEIPAAEDGSRRMFRRSGFETKDAAQDALDQVRTLLALATDEDDARQIGDMLDSLEKSEPLPDVESVQRKLRSGQDLVEKLTVGEWLGQWLEQEKGKHRHATEVSYRGHVETYLKPKLGHVRVDRLTVGHCVEAFAKIADDNDAIEAANADRRALVQQIKATSRRAEKRALREQLDASPPFRRTVGPSSQQRIRATLRAALNDAITQQKCVFNAAEHLELDNSRPKPIIWTPARIEQWRQTGQRPGRVLVWPPEVAGEFLDHIADYAPGEEALWHLLLHRGPRRGETAGLAWTEVDLDAGTVQITQQLVEVEYKVEAGAPKSAAGERTIPLDKAGVALLRAHRKRQNEERLRLGAAWVDSGKVFVRPDGSALRPSWIGDRFAEHIAAADLPPIRLHDLRHVAATLMLAAGVDLTVIKETLGHSALSTTSDLYASVLPQLASAAAEATAAIVPRRRPAGHPAGTQGDLGAATASGEVVEIRENRS